MTISGGHSVGCPYLFPGCATHRATLPVLNLIEPHPPCWTRVVQRNSSDYCSPRRLRGALLHIWGCAPPPLLLQVDAGPEKQQHGNK